MPTGRFSQVRLTNQFVTNQPEKNKCRNKTKKTQDNSLHFLLDPTDMKPPGKLLQLRQSACSA